jgi:regulator of RNase E activity RraA
MGPVHGPVFGPVRTLRYLPARADIPVPPSDHARTRVLDSLREGEVLVIQGVPNSMPAVGDLTGLRAYQAGAAAIVTDGTARDTQDLQRLGLPVFAAGTAPALSEMADIPWEYDTPIACGGVTVLPGDWIIADADGIVVLPASLLDQLAPGAERLLSQEEFSKALLGRGHRIADCYPIPERLRPAYEAWRKAGVLPDDATVRGEG